MQLRRGLGIYEQDLDFAVYLASYSNLLLFRFQEIEMVLAVGSIPLKHSKHSDEQLDHSFVLVVTFLELEQDWMSRSPKVPRHKILEALWWLPQNPSHHLTRQSKILRFMLLRRRTMARDQILYRVKHIQNITLVRVPLISATATMKQLLQAIIPRVEDIEANPTVTFQLRMPLNSVRPVVDLRRNTGVTCRKAYIEEEQRMFVLAATRTNEG